MPKELTKSEKEKAVNEWLKYGFLKEEQIYAYDTREQLYDSMKAGEIQHYQNQLNEEMNRQKDIDAMTRASLSSEEKRKLWISEGMPYKDFDYTKRYLDALEHDKKAAAAIDLKLRYDITQWKLNVKQMLVTDLTELEREAIDEYEADMDTYDQILDEYEAKKAARVNGAPENSAPENSAPVNSAPENKVQEDPAPSVQEPVLDDDESAALKEVITDDMKKQLDDMIAALDDGNMIFRSSKSEYGVMRDAAKRLRELVSKERTELNMIMIRTALKDVQEAARAYSVYKVGNENAQTDAKLSSNARKRLDAARKVLDFSDGLSSKIEPRNIAIHAVTEKVRPNGIVDSDMEKDFRRIGMASKSSRSDSLMTNAVEFYRQQHNLTKHQAYRAVRDNPEKMVEVFEMYRDFAQKNKVFDRGAEVRYKPDPELKAHVKALAEYYKNWYMDLANTKVENILDRNDYDVRMESDALVNCSQNEERLRDSYMAEMSEPFGGVEQRIEITDAVAAYQTFVYTAECVINENLPMEERVFNKFAYDKILKSCEGKDIKAIDSMDVKFAYLNATSGRDAVKSLKLQDHELRAYLTADASPEIRNKINSTMEKLYKDFEPIGATMDFGRTSPEKMAEIKDKAMREKCAEQIFELQVKKIPKFDNQKTYEDYMKNVQNTKAVEKLMENPKLIEQGDDLLSSAVYEMLAKKFKKPEPVQEKTITKQVEQQAPDMGMTL